MRILLTLLALAAAPLAHADDKPCACLSGGFCVCPDCTCAGKLVGSPVQACCTNGVCSVQQPTKQPPIVYPNAVIAPAPIVYQAQPVYATRATYSAGPERRGLFRGRLFKGRLFGGKCCGK